MTVKYITNIACPPAKDCGVFYWERTLDPWHPDAFSGIITLSWWAKLVRKVKGVPPRRQGWMAIDYAENAIGFIPDGYEDEVPDCKYVIRESYNARLCAIPDLVDLVEEFDERKRNGYYKTKTSN